MVPFLSRLRQVHLSPRRGRETLNAIQQQAYASEKEDNFRWLALLLATKSDLVLTSAHLVDDTTYSLISDIGQYAEIAHGSISPAFVFRNLRELCQPGFPLAAYDALRKDEAHFIKQFAGSVAGVQGYVAYRPSRCQLVLAFSGTSSVAQALKDIDMRQVAYSLDKETSKIHAGFWAMYRGVRRQAFDALRTALQVHGRDSPAIILTGHSMGCMMCYLLALDWIEEAEALSPRGLTLNLILFGSPRLGNEGLALYWKRSIDAYRSQFGDASFQEYSIKGYNDGIPSLPPHSLGFRHLTSSPLYFYHGRLYRVPASESERSSFAVADSASVTRSSRMNTESNQHLPAMAFTQGTQPNWVVWPRGGHNYYIRDMENFQRQMKWLELDLKGEVGWQERYMVKLKAWEAKWSQKLKTEVAQ